MTSATDTKPPHPAFGPHAHARDISILDSHIHYIESGEGRPIVFLHGNPTSSFLWRHIFRRLDGQGRLLAPDLIGFGFSGKPDIEYNLADHQRYLDAWFEELDLSDVTLILQDYGSTFGLDWARRHPDRVRAVSFFEPVLRAIEGEALSPEFISTRARIRSAKGETFVLEENRFLTELFPWFFLKPLSPDDLQHYLEPFPTAASRKPVLYFPRNLPVDGDPVTTVNFLAKSYDWLRDSDAPKLLLTFEPGFLLTPAILEWARSNIRNLEVEPAGSGIHFVQEEAPEEIAEALLRWLSRIPE